MNRILRFAAVLLAGLVAGSATAEPIKARLGTSLPDTHPQTLGARKFAEFVDGKTSGRIKIQVFSNGTLGNDVAMTSALQGGTIEFTVPSTATLATIVNEFGVFGLPFAFANEAEADGVLDGPFGQKLLAKLPEKGLVGLAYWENGFRNVTNSKRPITRVEDMEGLKIRTMQNPLYIDLFNGLGANAVPMAVTELYTALETRAVDAQENPYTVIYAQKFYDVQKYLSATGHAYDVLVLVASKKFWDKLPAADQKAVQEAAREAALFERKTSRELNARLREDLVKAGMQINDVPEAQRQQMREKLRPVIAKHAASLGDAFVKEFYAEIDKQRKPR